MLSTIQTGWVSIWNEEIMRMPCVTSGMTTSAEMIWPIHSGMPKASCRALDMIEASMAKRMKVKLA
ncbi:hypothetical protein D3C72_2498080 [compost metagenome]